MKIALTITAFLAFNLSLCALAMADPTDTSAAIGDACDHKTFVSRCDDRMLIVCNPKGIVEDIDCSSDILKLGSTCVEFTTQSKYPFDNAHCLSDDKRCHIENEIIVKEEIGRSGNTLKWHYKCEKTTNGDLFYRSTHDSASSQIDQSKLPNEIAERPNINHNTKRPRSKHAGESCDKANELFQFCEETSDAKAFKVLYKCTRNSNGFLILQKDSDSLCYGSNGKCTDDGKCVPQNPCDSKNYQSHCDGNKAINCIDNGVIETTCHQKAECEVSDGKAICINAILKEDKEKKNSDKADKGNNKKNKADKGNNKKNSDKTNKETSRQ